jgi:hypothetical protein
LKVLKKRAAVVVTVIMLAASPVSAQMMSLWGDESMSTCDHVATGAYTPFEVYVFLDPGPEGAFAVEYMLWIPPGHFSTIQTPAPFVSTATIGSWTGAPGISAPFTSCQTDLVWVCSVTMMSPDTEPNAYFLLPHNINGFRGVAICPGDRPLREVPAYNCFGFNVSCWDCSQYSTEETSWGKIKSLYRE